MEFIADLHVHSKYSRAVSRDMILPVMSEWAKKKGIDILATADWTHPLWFREIRQELIENSEGIFKLKDESLKMKENKETLFILSTEISSIYSQGGKTRRIHNLILSPSFETCEKINKELSKRGCNLMSDGRPIIGLSAIQLIELVLGIDEKTMIIPCHAWTPWFSLYGSNSGFDSIEECFGEYSKYIYAIETGLSSDPEMNWRIQELDSRSIISSSDSHSPAKMGREATVFKIKDESSKMKDDNGNFDINYHDITAAIKQEPDSNLRIRYTIEFYPEEGKYHYTGHRNCSVVQSPEETKEKGVICPVCHKPLTVGVMERVEKLAGRSTEIKTQEDKLGVRWIGDSSGKRPPYVKFVPLLEIIAQSLGSTVASVKTKAVFDEFCAKFVSEIAVLLKTPIEEIEKINPKIAEGVSKARKGDIVVEPGFDGEYGKVKIWSFVAEASSFNSLQDKQNKSINTTEELFSTSKTSRNKSQLAIEF